MALEKTLVYLDSDFLARARAIKTQIGTPVSTTVRRALDSYLDAEAARKDNTQAEIELIQRAIATAGGEMDMRFGQVVCTMRDGLTGRRIEVVGCINQKTGKFGPVLAHIPGSGDHPINRVLNREQRDEFTAVVNIEIEKHQAATAKPRHRPVATRKAATSLPAVQRI